jgi:hypothetical protein
VAADYRPVLPQQGEEQAPHILDIVHMTVVQWADKPGNPVAAAGVFDRAARRWELRELLMESATTVFERVPYMHMLAAPGGGGDVGASEFVWWLA